MEENNQSAGCIPLYNSGSPTRVAPMAQNLTEGKEELPFYINGNGEQIFIYR